MTTEFEKVVGMKADEFFSDYWGKKVLFVKGAFPAAAGVIAPDDLAGLACEVEASRLVRRNESDWSVAYGPFDESTFAALPESDWTLLVQEVERHDPRVNALLSSFRCFPNWRLDDVMISYAVPGGNVGAHVDKYDVFLVQSLGRRRWEIGLAPLMNPDFVEGLDLRILSEFVPDKIIDAEPGDLLYLPPMFAHHGVATSECITVSVGFRKPLVSDMVAAFLTDMLSRMDPERQLRYSQARAPDSPGLLDFETMEAVRSVFRAICYDEDSIDEWFGSYITSPSRGGEFLTEEDWSADEIRQFLVGGGILLRSSISLATYLEGPGDSVRLFAMGEMNVLPSELAAAAALLTGDRELDYGAFSSLAEHSGLFELLAALANRGFLLPLAD